jgi:hypothetical protein
VSPPAMPNLLRSAPASMALIAVPLAVLAAWRGDTRDTTTYIDAFVATQRFPDEPVSYYTSYGLEWGFALLSWTFNSVGLSFHWLFLSVSCATFYCLYRTSKLLGLRFSEVLPFYLGSFFLLQQLMLIRQGFGVALAVLVVVAGTVRGGLIWRAPLGAAASGMMHLVSIVPIITGAALAVIAPTRRRATTILWALSLAVASFAAARIATSLELVTLFDRLSHYASDAELGATRNIFEPANVRAALILLVLFAAPASLLSQRAFVVLLGMYSVHVGLRLGFLDFAILSGRLASALGFVEVFLLPLLLREAIRTRWLRSVLAASFFAVHISATLALQVPYLLEDYFRPLPAEYSPR